MSKHHRLVLIIFLLCCSVTAKAQREKIYLKNGSVIRGTITNVGTDTASILIDSVTTLDIKTSSIEGIRTRKRKTQLSYQELTLIDSLNRLLKKSQSYHQFNVGFLYGEDGTFNTALSNLAIDYAFHIKSRRKASVGMGIGLEYYPSFEVIPFFLEYRRDFKHLPSGTFFYVRAGYSLAKARSNFINSSSSVKGEEAFGLGLGQQWPIGKNKLIITIGYKKQNIRTVRRSGSFEALTDWSLRRLEFKVGLTF